MLIIVDIWKYYISICLNFLLIFIVDIIKKLKGKVVCIYFMCFVDDNSRIVMWFDNFIVREINLVFL